MTAVGVEHGLVDLHSHLVPGVDDGARDLDEAVEAVGRLEGAGVRLIVTTPHLDVSVLARPEVLERRLEQVRSRFDALVHEAAKRFPKVELRLGFEVLLDVPDPAVSDARVRLGGSRYLLVEWPRLRVPRGTQAVLQKIHEQGVVPIIAHPERYAGLGRGLALAEEWRRAGALLQVNHGSLHGRYGSEARDRAVSLLEHGWVDLLSSDFHARAHLEPYVEESRAWFDAQGALETFEALTAGNPRRVLDDGGAMPVAPLEVHRGPLARIRSLLGIGGPR